MTTAPQTTEPTPEQRALALRVADRLASLPHYWSAQRERIDGHDAFDMADWGTSPSSFSECGTHACVAGWTVRVADGADEFARLVDLQGEECAQDLASRAAQLLGLSYQDADLLFIWGPSTQAKIELTQVTGPQAARVLRHYAATGRVDWSVAASGAPATPNQEF